MHARRDGKGIHGVELDGRATAAELVQAWVGQGLK
jgi:hypothetical protein